MLLIPSLSLILLLLVQSTLELSGFFSLLCSLLFAIYLFLLLSCLLLLSHTHTHTKVFGVLPLQRHPSPLSGSIWFFIVFSILSLIFFLITVFTNIFFLSYHCFTYIFLFTVLLELIFFHVSAFSWLFLISLCRSFHIFSSVLFFVLFSCPPNRNSPRTWSVSSILGLCKDLLSIRHFLKHPHICR